MKIVSGLSFVSLHRLAWALVVILICALGVANCRHSDAAADLAVRSMEAAGWQRAAKDKPKIPDLPVSAKPVATIAGAVIYKPIRSRPAQEPSTPPSPSAGDLGRCDLDALEVTLDCRAELALAAAVPMGRLWVQGIVKHGELTRTLPWKRVGDPIPLRLPGGAEQPVETAEPEVHAKLPPPVDRFTVGLRRPSAWRVGWVAGIGVAYDPFDKRTAPAAFVGYGVQF